LPAAIIYAASAAASIAPLRHAAAPFRRHTIIAAAADTPPPRLFDAYAFAAPPLIITPRRRYGCDAVFSFSRRRR